MKNLVKTVFANPKTTAAGIGALALTAFKCYGMATGTVPVSPETIQQAAATLTAGAGLLFAHDGKAPQ